MCCFTRLILIFAVAVAILPPRPGNAAASRTVSATATCVTGDGGTPSVSVTLVNHAGAALVVSYFHGFTTPPAFAVRLRLVAPDASKSVSVANGTTRTLTTPWDDLLTGDGDSGGALVVTNFGVLAPVCGAASPVTLTLGPAPTSRSGAKLEAVKLAATTLGQLEAWRAYPALYALLHPDARAEVSFGAVACWYAAQLGTADVPAAAGIVSTSVDGASFGTWTWPLNGRSYSDAATVKVTQQIGSAAATQPVTSTEHLVLADGQWRWFFGSSRAALAAMPTTCPLVPAASSKTTSATASPTPKATASPALTTTATPTPRPTKTATASPTPAAATATPTGLGSITVTNYVCPEGMTLANLVRADCSVEPAAARWTLTGHQIKGPKTWSETTQHAGPGHTWAGLPFGEYVLNPAALPKGVTLYAIGGSDNIARQDKGIAVTLGPGEPNINLGAYLIAPVNVTPAS